MKNKLLGIFLYFFFSIELNASSIQIQAKNITLDKDQITSIFKDQVIVKSNDKIIESDYVKYNKKTGFLIIKENVKARDSNNNIIETQYAEYYENKNIYL